ncbi:UNVERIFIED_CONTAM: Piriformospora indica-insensitive protein 2 [Sesamum radiatum]|uniref:Piriformospora indica-insensitive protein 2 n=1 Tax=Sesamum radiatum TaxID=300843 RepID=A0AAW2VLG0_SESRA
MKKLKHLSLSILVLCIFYLSAPCNGEDESSAATMKRTEQEALYSAVQGFVGKWWNGSDLYPDPCGWTPIQGVSCDLFDGFWYVTDLSIGPVHDNSLSCAQNVEFSSHLFALRHLRSLSFFNCFVSPRQRPVSIPSTDWEVLAESLESLEFRSNPGLTGEIPVAFGLLRNLQSLVLMENGLSGELPESIGNLINLRRLNLAANLFKGRIPDSFGGLNHLLILDMSRNSLSGFLPMTFGLAEARFEQQPARRKNPTRVWKSKQLNTFGPQQQQIIRCIDSITSRTELLTRISPFKQSHRWRNNES